MKIKDCAFITQAQNVSRRKVITRGYIMLRKLGIYTVLLLMVVSCKDETTVGTQDAEQTRTLVSDTGVSDVEVIVIPDITVDAWVDPCLDLANTDELYCDCNPTCCQRQTWYCPPRGVEIQASRNHRNDGVRCTWNASWIASNGGRLEEASCFSRW